MSDHQRWLADIKEATGDEVAYPIIGDYDLKIAKLYGMLPADAGESSQGRTSVSDAEAKDKYPDGWRTVKPYLRVIPQPRDLLWIGLRCGALELPMHAQCDD